MEETTSLEVQVEIDALRLEALRVVTLVSKLYHVSLEASDAFVLLDALDSIHTSGASASGGACRTPKFTDILFPLRTLGEHAQMECEERAVEIDYVLEMLIHIVDCLESNEVCAIASTKYADFIHTSQELRVKPLLLITEAISKLETVSAVTKTITENPEALHASLTKAVATKNMLAQLLLIADGRANPAVCELDVLVAAAQAGYTGILRALGEDTRVSHHIAHAARFMLLEPPSLRQEMFDRDVIHKNTGIRHPMDMENEMDIMVLLAHLVSGRVGPSPSPNETSDALLAFAVDAQDVLAIETLIAHPCFGPTNGALLDAVECNFIVDGPHKSAIVKAILGFESSNAHVHLDLKHVLNSALVDGDLDVVTAVLADPRFDFDFSSRFYANPFVTAVTSMSWRRMELLALLLADKRANPGMHHNEAFEIGRAHV